MKLKVKDFIGEIISSDFKHISNQDFNRVTLEKIEESEVRKVTISNSGDITFLFPVITYGFFIILLSLIGDIISWPLFGRPKIVMNSIEMISSFLMHPVTISILLSFSLLYLTDLYLNKVSAHNDPSSAESRRVNIIL